MHCAPSTAAYSPEFPQGPAPLPMQERHGFEIETPRLIEANPRRSSAAAKPELVEVSRRSVANLSPILSDSHGDKAARPMRRSTPGRAGSARSLSGDIMGLLDFGDQRIPVFRNAVDLARAPIRLAQTSVGVPCRPISSAIRLFFSSSAGALSERAKRKFW